MPDKTTLRRLARDRREGKAASTQAGEFVREEVEHIRAGKHGVRSAKQAIAIGLSKARRAGVELPPPDKRSSSAATRRKARQDNAAGHHPHKPSRTRARATTRALRREPRSNASHDALARQSRSAARKRTHAERSASARRAARTKGPTRRAAAARKAARTRRRRE